MAQRVQLPLGSSYSPAVAVPPLSRARATRWFNLALAVAMTGIVIAGFWPTYFGRMLDGAFDRPWIIHVHAAVFLGWMALLLTQVALVLLGRRDAHRRIGRAGIGYGALVLCLGLAVTFAAPIMRVVAGEWTRSQAAAFLILPLGDMVLFAALFGAAIAYRTRSEIHKRLMLLATVALLFAPSARMAGEHGPLVLLLVWMAPVAIAMAHDLWVRRRVHGAYLAGTALLLVGFVRVLVMESPGWVRIGGAILDVFMPESGAGAPRG